MASARQPPLAARAQNPTSSAASGSRVFPLRPFKYLPGVVRALMPGTMQTIQDWTHLVLVAGTVICGIQIARTAASMWAASCTSWMCLKELISLAFFFRCECYMVSIIGQFEHKLQEKQQAARREKDNLTRSYNDMIAEMDSLLQKSAESSAGLAERSFESKRRDFQRFLERVKSKYSAIFSGTKKNSDQLLREFKRFCNNWLHVFEECSIDPVNAPKRVVSRPAINQCQSIEQVADLCLSHLRTTEVRFISSRRDQDAALLKKNKGDYKRLTVKPAAGAELLALPDSVAVSNNRPCSWVQLGGPIGCYLRSSTTDDGYPKDCRVLCGQLIILSNEHAALLLGMLAGVVLILYDLALAATEGDIVTLLSSIVAESCIIVMLLRFEELDVIQQLTREVQQLSKHKEQLGQQREKMAVFWNNVHSLTELWLYRTVPRLDLYKEVHSQLEDTKDDLITSLAGANQQLEDLENKLGALEAWRNDGEIKTEDKKQFGKVINGVCQEPDLVDILIKLENNLGGMKMLK
eukprot:TRINITY_DN4527_c0_g1_i1.p1 TRINITY_DN4527_c0_g1~~TRINITY_DN4527_c0_g1_i1.p1  ORF type:complete len:522 (-),score=87.50 TRINITY_DN4527_c0_g1_i1:247-1812(-)